MRGWKWEQQQRERSRKQSRQAKAKLQGKPDPEPEPPAHVDSDPVAYSGITINGSVSGPLTWSWAPTIGLSPIRAFLGLPPMEPKPREPLTKRQQVEPIVAYKRAAVAGDPLRLYGVGMHAPYHPDDTARCVGRCIYASKRSKDCICAWCQTEPHDVAPHEGCRCGFYGMDKTMLGKLGSEYGTGIADLQVELSGKVIRHEKGYRAQYQRVLGVFLDQSCTTCRRSASVLAVRPASEYFISFSTLTKTPETLSPLCSLCAPADRPRYKPADLANAWGIEVTWGSIE